MKKGFQIYAWVVAAVAVLLIWWGAAVTTEGVGMAVPGWPLMYGQINPDGWWKVWAYFLEHGHRLIASLVGTMTLIAFGLQFVRKPVAFFELLGLTIFLAAVTWTVHKQMYGLSALGGLICVAWLVWGWTRRDWPTLTKLTALALILVSLQAALGGIRVLEVSDSFAVVHGCLAQLFFCVLILICLASSAKWERRGTIPERHALALRWCALCLFGAVFFQLIFGALMRHHHRFGLASDGIFLTGTAWFPGTGDFDLLILFLHKWWAVVVFSLAVTLAVWAWPRLGENRALRRFVAAICWLVVAQLLLGVSVIMTGKTFWVTNFHVLNGLAILTTSFVLVVKTQRAES